MLNVIIVEDDLKMQKVIQDIVNKSLFNSVGNYDIKIFSKFDNNLEKIILDNSMVKIFILDIELSNNISGVQIAKLIREKDWDSEIIFLTNHDKMFEPVHRNIFKVFDFIEKFHNMDKRLKKDLLVILNMKIDNAKFYYSNNKIDLQLYLKDITYIYRNTRERKLVICTTNNKFTVRMNIKDILKQLDDRFILVHRACIVNKERVNKYCWAQGYFILDTKENVYLLSKKFKNEVKK